MPTTTKAQMAFDLAIAGRKVTPSNCNDLTVLDGVAGKVSFDPNENVLTLEDATIETEANVNAIYSKIEGLTIKVIGTKQTNIGQSRTHSHETAYHYRRWNTECGEPKGLRFVCLPYRTYH